MHYTLCLAVLSSGLFAQAAVAEVFKCKEAGGKTTYSQIPCITHDARATVLRIAAPPPPDPLPARDGNDVAFRNDTRMDAGEQTGTAARRTSPMGSTGNSLKPPPARPTDQQIIAQCEANHGARCSSAGEIAQRRMEQRELSPAERQQQHNAVAARRQRAQDEAFQRATRR